MNRFTKTVFLTGMFVGTTDLLYAYINQWIKTGKLADKMLQYIAGGALGLENSMQAGPWVGFLGLFFHYFIAMSFTLLFFLVFPKLKFLAFNKYFVGVLYGIFVSLTMSYLILPLTRLPAGGPFNLSAAIVNWYVFGFIFGIPIAYNAYKYYGVEIPGK